MSKIAREFVSKENREYKFKLGRSLASSLFGFICGAVVATIVILSIWKYLG